MPAETTARSRTIQGLDELRELIGHELGVSEWVTVTQSMIDAFAETTGDWQWIHVDIERSRKESPFKTTIAHGFLVLSLAAPFGFEVVKVEGVRLGLNYGLDRVRFTAPVHAGSRVRARISLDGVRDIPTGALAEFSYQFESDMSAKPVCIAHLLSLYVE